MGRDTSKVSRRMSDRPLAELDLPVEDLAGLGELAQVRTVRDFAVLGRFPEHCLTLAGWLDVPVEWIRSISSRAAAHVPAAELDAYADKIRPTLRFPLGMCPPQAA